MKEMFENQARAIEEQVLRPGPMPAGGVPNPPKFEVNSLPLPIIHSDFVYTARAINDALARSRREEADRDKEFFRKWEDKALRKMDVDPETGKPLGKRTPLEDQPMTYPGEEALVDGPTPARWEYKGGTNQPISAKEVQVFPHGAGWCSRPVVWDDQSITDDEVAALDGQPFRDHAGRVIGTIRNPRRADQGGILVDVDYGVFPGAADESEVLAAAPPVEEPKPETWRDRPSLL